jgi:group I intron endonuclease
MEQKSGIYKIENKHNGKVYIGQSKDLEGRWKKHNWLFKNNKNIKSLQNEYNLYSENPFDFFIIEYCDEIRLSEREEYYVDKYNSIKDGYNKKRKFDVTVFSDEVKEKMRDRVTGENNPMFNKECSDELKQIRSINAKNKSKKHREKISKANKGKTYSRNEETKKKISEKSKLIKRTINSKGQFTAKEITQDMIDDILIDINPTDFSNKYNLSKSTFYRIKAKISNSTL